MNPLNFLMYWREVLIVALIFALLGANVLLSKRDTKIAKLEATVTEYKSAYTQLADAARKNNKAIADMVEDEKTRRQEALQRAKKIAPRVRQLKSDSDALMALKSPPNACAAAERLIRGNQDAK